MTTKEKLLMGALALAGMAVIGVNARTDAQIKQGLAEKHAGELSRCWADVASLGGTCELEFKTNTTGDIVGAEVIHYYYQR